MLARLADVPITVEILPEAQRMVDEADERWVTEHGFLPDNPRLGEILRASDLLRTNPQSGVIVRRGRLPRRSSARRDPCGLARQPWQHSSTLTTS